METRGFGAGIEMVLDQDDGRGMAESGYRINPCTHAFDLAFYCGLEPFGVLFTLRYVILCSA